MTIETPTRFVYIYRGPNPALKGRACSIRQTWRGKGPHNVLVEFLGGPQTRCPMGCLRKMKGNAATDAATSARTGEDATQPQRQT